MLGVDEELRAARVGHTGVGHGQRADLVGELGRELVGDVAAAVTRDRLTWVGSGLGLEVGLGLGLGLGLGSGLGLGLGLGTGVGLGIEVGVGFG